MNILHGLAGLRQLPPGSVLSIGNFDGVHRGHQGLLRKARELRSCAPGTRVAVATFEPHPLTVLRPEKAPPRLLTLEMKRALLDAEGADDLVELAPEPAVLNLTAEQFWALLRDEVRPSHLVEGSEFNFGKDRGGNIARLREWSAGSDVQLHVVGEVEIPLLDLRLAPISSTLVRWLVMHGRVREAAICLGRPYALQGEVITGHQRGRTIGVPTANLRCDRQLVPADGVYAGRCAVDGVTFPAAVSIGTLPTFGEHDRQIEAHLIGFTGDLYGRALTVELIDWLRDQRKYDGIDPLKAQIAFDVMETIRRGTDDASRPIAAM